MSEISCIILLISYYIYIEFKINCHTEYVLHVDT